jgi:hypothetical protein
MGLGKAKEILMYSFYVFIMPLLTEQEIIPASNGRREWVSLLASIGCKRFSW